jgi:hypothetical protein
MSIIPIPTVQSGLAHQPVANPAAASIALDELTDLLLNRPVKDGEAQALADKVSTAAYKLHAALDWSYDNATPIEWDLINHVSHLWRADVRIHIERKVGLQPGLLYKYTVDAPLRTLIGLARGLGLDKIGDEK